MAAAKPKINLKARLGRKSGAPSAAPPPAGVPAGQSAAPPPQAGIPGAAPSAAPPAAAPVAQSGFPSRAPSAAPAAGQGFALPGAAAGPPAGGSIPTTKGPGGQSIPAPPGFGAAAQASVRPAPAVTGRPAAAAPAPVAAAAPLSIKMDLGEEVVEAQRQGKKKVMMLAAVMAAVGLAVGFGIGQLAKGNEGAKAAVQGAELLLKDIDEANTKISELEGLLKGAAAKVKAGEFPAEQIEKMGALEVPFDGSNLTNKGIGRFNPTAVTMLLQYANSVQSAKDKRDKIRRVFGAAKETFEKRIKEKKDPHVYWGVSVVNGPKGPWGRMSLLEPFAVNKAKDKKYKWPGEIKAGKGKKSRYKKGDPLKGDSAQLIPVDPASQLGVCPTNLNARLMSALLDLRKAINGDQTPGREVMGLVELGDKVSDQLRKIGGPG